MEKYLTEKLLIRILIYELRDKNPNSVTFVVDDATVNSVLLHLKTDKYTTLLYTYGSQFLLELLNYYEDLEMYEKCALIKETIESHNKLANDVLPTRN